MTPDQSECNPIADLERNRVFVDTASLQSMCTVHAVEREGVDVQAPRRWARRLMTSAALWLPPVWRSLRAVCRARAAGAAGMLDYTSCASAAAPATHGRRKQKP